MSYPARRGSRHPAQSGWWDPFAEIEAMHKRLDQLFFGTPSPRWDRPWAGDVDLEETDEGWVVEAQLPGVPPEGVDVDLGDRELSIRGEAGDGDQGRGRRQFAYRLTLPGEVDTDRAEANLEHGVLTVKLPRSARATSRKLQVGTGGRNAIGATASGTEPESAGSWSDSIPTTAPPAAEEAPQQSYAEPAAAQPEAAYPPEPAPQPEAPYQAASYPQSGYDTEPAAAGRYPVPGQAQPGVEQPLPDQPPSDQTPGAGYPPEAGYPPQDSQQAAYPGWTGQEPSEPERRDQST